MTLKCHTDKSLLLHIICFSQPPKCFTQNHSHWTTYCIKRWKGLFASWASLPRRTRQARDKRQKILQIGTQKAEQPDEHYGRIQCQANNHIQHLIHKDHFPLQLIKKTEEGGEHRNQKLCSSLGVVRKSQISSLISNVIVDKLFTNKY